MQIARKWAPGTATTGVHSSRECVTRRWSLDSRRRRLDGPISDAAGCRSWHSSEIDNKFIMIILNKNNKNYYHIACVFLAGLAPIVASAMAWIVIFFTVLPGDQDFPLNDDWAYALGALQFSQGSGIDYFNWSSTPLLGMWIWATPFIRILGPSNVALRISVIVLSWVGLMAFRDLLRQGGAGPWMATFGTLVFAFNPLFFMMSGTFMTDVPTLAMSLLALACYGRGFHGSGHPGFLVVACLAATMAAITRQSVLGLSIAVAVSLLQRSQLRRRPLIWMSVILPGLACMMTAAWFGGRPDVVVFRPLFPSWERVFSLTTPLMITIGLCCLPAALLVWRPSLGWWWLFGLLSCGGVAWIAFRRMVLGRTLLEGGLFPYFGNVLTPYGSFGTGLVLGDRSVVLSTWWRIGLSMLGCLGAAVLLIRLGTLRLSKAMQQPLLLWYVLFQIPFLIISLTLFDRYLIVFIPTALFIMVHEAVPSRRGVVLGLAGLMVLVASSLAFTHDWLAWNAARWELGRRAVVLAFPRQRSKADLNGIIGSMIIPIYRFRKLLSTEV